MLPEAKLTAILQENGLKLVKHAVGSGGSAYVHRAEVTSETEGMPSSGTSVAVKEFREEILGIPNQIERIRQEAHIGSNVAHRHVATAYKLIETQDYALLALEWIEGMTLCDWLQEH